ncbi:hypothetical protein SAMN05216257_10141 [Meinhardsimonia xiamenensis]|jgi:hypothetical protein|uniref:Uncharacterized protein n=1 Tax=Meinhardsimonia xiamenensis TaxID=990712 RepID=A0A1G8XSN9_9RHOB|nr:hypothetical protein [Meinhardsimonia xiamenensis]PRX37025.1 hypothetical protein LV81_00797 [Meinhardsimonia xiamenensis]SDJ93456.1 hypothetical protein SAMN05216257_10141 [Meinhardsimonia xiamenensis]
MRKNELSDLLIAALRMPLRLPGTMGLVFLAAALTQLLAILPLMAIALVGAEARFLTVLADRSGAERNPRAASAVLIRLLILFPLAVPLVGMWLMVLPAVLVEPFGLSDVAGMSIFLLLLQLAGAGAALWRLGPARGGGRWAPATAAALAATLPWAAHFLWGGDALAPSLSGALAFGVSETLAMAVIGAAAFPEPRTEGGKRAEWVHDALAFLGETLALVRRAPLALAVVLAAIPSDPLAFFFFSWSISTAPYRSWAEQLPEDAVEGITLLAWGTMVAALAHLVARVGGRMWPRPMLKALAVVFGALTLRVAGWYLMTVLVMLIAVAAGWNGASAAPGADVLVYPLLLALAGAASNLLALAVMLVARPALARAVAGAQPGKSPAIAAVVLSLLGMARVGALFVAFGLGEVSAIANVLGIALFGLVELLTLAALACAALGPATADPRAEA